MGKTRKTHRRPAGDTDKAPRHPGRGRPAAAARENSAAAAGGGAGAPAASLSRGEITETLLATVRDLALELHPRRQPEVRLEHELDRDLGFDSLARSELMLRLDRTFGVHLPDQLIGEAETVRDLLDAVLAAAPQGAPARRETPQFSGVLPEVAEPVDAATLVEVLQQHAGHHGDRPHVLLWLDDEEQQTITYGDLESGARKVAGGLAARGLRPGERVALMLPTEAGFFAAFFGVLYAGGVPVPIYPPFRRSQVEDHLRRQAGILGNAEAGILITNAEIRNVGTLLYGLAPSLRRIELISDLLRAEPAERPAPATAETTALIQYTSGSTGDPKGVVLTHANLLANIRAMGRVLDASAADIFVSWLPLYHDMGLIGAWLGCLYYGARTVIMPPLAFLADPLRWLWAIHRHHATLTAAPNFAFELCLKAMRSKDMTGLDLCALRRACNGAEPVSAATLAAFADALEPYGLSRDALAPVYGLAECSVGLAFPPHDRPPLIDRVVRQDLARSGRAEPAGDSRQDAFEFVACGRPLPGHEVRIVDEQGFELPERREGRLEFRGPSATSGYFRNEEKTRLLFHGDWLDSGDTGYVAGGDIFITGRVKDIIIRAGRNIYPHELEDAVGSLDGVRRGCVAAFASADARRGTERLIMVAETRLDAADALAALRARIADTVRDIVNLPPDDIVLVPPGTVPKTSSGKIRRAQARALYERGALLQPRRALWLQLARLALAGAGNRLRILARGLATMVYAAWWWSALLLIALPLWVAVLCLPGRARRQRSISAAARLFFRLTGIGLEVSGGPLPECDVVLAVNHSSYLDGAVVSAAFPGPLTFVAKQELSAEFVAGTFLKRIGTLFVRRSDPAGGVEDTGTILAAARGGERIVAFPEATLSRMPGLREFRLGAFQVAVDAGIPVVPLTICGTRSVLRGGQWLPRRGDIKVQIGDPVAADGRDFSAAIRLRDIVRAAMLAASGEPDLASSG